MKKILGIALAVTGLSAFASEARADCGSVSIAEMNWASAGIIAQIDRIILESGYGCKVEIVSGDTLPTFNSMTEKGQPDVAPELWINSFRAQFDKAVADGRLVAGAPTLADGAVEGWWIPKYLSDQHRDIKTVQQALARPDLFPSPRDPAKGAIYNCPDGWSCQVSTANLFKALGGQDKNFELLDTGSATGLDESIAKAFSKKAGWLGYYWAPTAILGKYEMVKLSFGVPHDKLDWDGCTVNAQCLNPKVNSYPTSQAFAVTTKSFADRAGVVLDYFKARKWTNTTVNAVLAWQDDKRGSNADAARHFLNTMPEIWSKWVAPDVAAKIRAAL